MSACSNTVRALSRSCAPTKKTLLPFLYQTSTIQQWTPVARRSISRYSRKDEPPAVDIPFESEESLPPALDDTQGPRKTTITGSERAAFQKLYRRFNTRGSRQQEKDHEVEIDAIADEYWEPDEDENPSASLDKIFDDALKKGAEATRERNRSGAEQLRSRKPKQDLQSMAEHVLKGTKPTEMQVRAVRAQRKTETSAQAAELKKLRLRERKRVDALLTSAKTDRELWETLHREVFDQVRQLDLDSTAPRVKKENRTRTAKFTPDPKVLFSNYPHHLLTALITLRTHFPASPIPLSILPAIKSFGRSSYALGATTALYNQLLRTAWLQQSSYSLLISLMADMHNGAVEFNADTLAVLDQVLKEFTMARSGKLGRSLQMVYGLDQFKQGIRELTKWRAIVAERVGIEDGRRERGSVPVPRRRKAGDEQIENDVPLVEEVNDVAEQARAQPLTDSVSQHAPKQALVHDVDPGAEFDFLKSDDSGDVPQVQDEADDTSNEQVAPLDEKAYVEAEETLERDVEDDVNEEADKKADRSEAAAKTSTGDAVPWTPS